MTKTATAPTTTAPKFASLAAAADIAGVSVKSLRRYIAAGRITGYRVGPRMIRVNLNELQDFLAPIPVKE